MVDLKPALMVNVWILVLRRRIYTKAIFFLELYAPVDPSWIVCCLVQNWHLESYGIFKHEIQLFESCIST